MDYSKELVIQEVKKINSKGQFSKYVNNRDYELDVTELAKHITVNKDVFSELSEFINSSLERYKNKAKELEEESKLDDEDLSLAFTTYFVLFTMCRRQKYGDVLDLVAQYKEKFENYHMMEHIDLMAQLDRTTHPSTLFRAIKRSEEFLQLKEEGSYNFGEHVGALNVFCGLVCKYFETNLDEKNDSDKKNLINEAYKAIIKAIKIDKERKANQSKSAYAKFYLNRGRVQVLKGKYTQGEDDIHLAISCIGDSDDRASTVNEYNQYLLKASIIRAYDINEKKIQDLDKVKVSNYKSIALMTTLLGFLLGAINIFTTIEEPFTLAMLMLCYGGILLALLGIILFGLSLTLKDRKVRLLTYDIVLIVLGALIFSISMWIILT